MHNEDGELGLWVESASGERWKAFGDGRLPGRASSSKATSTNLEQCRKAIQQSIAEVQEAFHSKKVIAPSNFAAWHHAPMLDKVSTDAENHRPLLKVQKGELWMRVGGASSEEYKAINSINEWATFWTDNFSQVEGQVRLIAEKFIKTWMK